MGAALRPRRDDLPGRLAPEGGAAAAPDTTLGDLAASDLPRADSEIGSIASALEDALRRDVPK